MNEQPHYMLMGKTSGLPPDSGHDEAWLLSALDSAEVGMWHLDPSRNIVRLNDRCKELFGFSWEDEVRYSQLRRHIHPADRGRVAAAVASALDPSGNGLYDIEFRIIREGQPMHWLRGKGKAVFDPEGRVVRFAGIVLDNTEKITLRNAHIESEQKTQMALEAANMGTWRLYLPENRLEWDMGCQKIFHWYEPTLHFSQFLAALHPDDARKVTAILQNSATVPDGQTVALTCRVIMPPEGRQHWIRLNGKHLSHTDYPIGYFTGTAVDISRERQKDEDLRNLQKRFGELVEEAPMATAIYVTEDMIIELANEKMIELWGKDASVIGKPFLEAIPELRGQPFIDILRNVYRTGVAYQTNEAPAQLNRDGHIQTYYLGFTYKPLKNEKGEVYAILHMAVDITDKKILAQELEMKVLQRTEALRSINAELLRSNQELEQFAYVASHDMQEPIRKIFTFSQMLQSDDHVRENEKVLLSVTKIHDSAERALDIIRDLLDLSYLSGPEKNFEATNLNQILRNVLVDLELLIVQKEAQITWEELPEMEAIPLQINQLFYNLVSNFLKFTRPGVKAVLSITSRLLSFEEISHHSFLSTDQCYFELVFSDNGIGFDQQYAKKIFTVFQRLHNRQAYSGTGIGLALCKKVTENHHGEIFALSGKEKGAAFHVILPFKQRNILL